MQQSEKNLLEKLADAIPGLKGYREKESRRDTDKRFRNYLADRIDRARGNLDELKRTLVNQGKLDGLAELDRLSQKMIKSANQIRHASYGYSGFFDQVRITDDDLDRIYEHDLSMLSDVEALETSLKNQEAAQEWESRIQAIDQKLHDRKNLFSLEGR